MTLSALPVSEEDEKANAASKALVRQYFDMRVHEFKHLHKGTI